MKGLPYLVGAIEPLREDPITLQPVLHALEKLLDLGKRRMLERDGDTNIYAEVVEEFGGLSALESLANTGHSSVYEIVTSIIERFFDRDDEDHDGIEVSLMANADEIRAQEGFGYDFASAAPGA